MNFYNPNALSFHPNRPCIHPKEHVGRKTLVQHAYGRLNTDDIQSFAIIGFHREGKTSFVNYLRHKEISDKYLHTKNYLFLYIDLAEEQIINNTLFFNVLYNKAREISSFNLPDVYPDLNKINCWLRECNKRLVIILDNFNFIVTNPNFKVTFYENLRSWFSTHEEVGCILTSPIQLLKLAMPTELAGSPFFNIFDSYILPPLKFNDATEIFYNCLPNDLQEYKSEISFLLDEVGTNPYLLHLAGDVLLKNYEKNNKLDIKEINEKIYEFSQPYYENIYSLLKNKQLQNIFYLLDKKEESLLSSNIDNFLLERGWVNKQGKITARHFERFFKQRMNITDKSKKVLFSKIISIFTK